MEHHREPTLILHAMAGGEYLSAILVGTPDDKTPLWRVDALGQFAARFTWSDFNTL